MGRKKIKSHSYIKANPFSWKWMVPLVIIVAIIPLIMRGHMVVLSEEQQRFWSQIYYLDFFSYYKAWWFIITSYTGALILLYLWWSQKVVVDDLKQFWPLGIYAFFVLGSYLFSSPKSISTFGYFGVNQGVFVLIGYVISVIISYYLIQSKTHIRILVGSLIFVGLGVTLIGLTQYTGNDIFATDFGQNLILPDHLKDLSGHLHIRFGQSRIYATMYNTNFVGSFAALMIPFSFALILGAKKFYTMTLALIFFAMMVFVGFGSNSRAGIIGLSASFFMIIVMFRKNIYRNPIKFILPFLVIGSTGYVLNEYSEGRIMSELRSLSIFSDIESAQDRLIFHRQEIRGNDVILDTEEEGLIIRYESDNTFAFYTLDEEPIPFTYNESIDRYTPDDERYQDFRVDRQSSGEATIRAYGNRINIFITMDGLKSEDVFGNRVAPSSPRTIDALEPYGSMFSSRVSIWSRSIPLLSDNLLIGEGPDMFVTAYPNDALLQNSIMDKPHNLYLQIGINTGVISLLFISLFFLKYLFNSFILYIKGNYSTFEHYLGVGVMSSVFAYLVTGMFNDQIISVAPLFYVMLGFGLAINRYVKTHQSKPL